MSDLSWAPIYNPNTAEAPCAGGMIYACNRIELEDLGRSSVVAIGAFDGLHVGHQSLLRAAMLEAHERSVPCVVVTFDPDPAEVVGSSQNMHRLLSTADRRSGMLLSGIDYVVSFDFTEELASCAPAAFVDAILRITRPVSMHVGKNFRFGNKGSGTVNTLRELGSRTGFNVCEHELVQSHGSHVSATRVRDLLASSRLDEANELLGRCHYVRGIVEHGRGEGTTFGFPTANVSIDMRDCVPAEGVYACYLTQGNTAWPAAANVGAPPTFTDEVRPAFLEANLLGFSGDLYGSEVAVSFVTWLRASRPFDSLAELERTVLGNIDWVRQHLGDEPREMRP